MLDLVFGFIFGVSVGIFATLTLQAYEEQQRENEKENGNDE